FLLLRSERLALRGDTAALLLELLNPSAQSGIHHTQRTARLDVAVALIQNQSRSLSFELGGKSTSLLAHQTPLYRRDFRLNRCPGSVDHYSCDKGLLIRTVLMLPYAPAVAILDPSPSWYAISTQALGYLRFR